MSLKNFGGQKIWRALCFPIRQNHGWIQGAFVSLFVAVFFTMSCQQSFAESPSLQPEDLRPVLLSLLDGNFERAEELAVQGDGIWFALAAGAEAEGWNDVALECRRRSASSDAEPFGRLSLGRLLEDDPQALVRPLQALRQMERRQGDEGLRGAKIAVLADQNRFRDLVRLWDEASMQPQDAPVWAAMALRHRQDEVVMGQVADFVRDCMDPLALEVFFEFGVFDGERNAYENLSLESKTPPSFFQLAQVLTQARWAYSQEDFAGAEEGYVQWLRWGGAPPGGGNAPVFSEMVRCATALGTREDWVEILKSSPGFGAAFASGRLYSALGKREQAAEQYGVAHERATTALEKDRAEWSRLVVLRRGGVLSGAADAKLLVESAPRWEDAERFDDVLEDFVHLRVRRGEWAALDQAWSAGGWPSESRALGAYALGMAVAEGRWRNEAQSYLLAAYEASPLSWPGLRAAALLGKDPIFPGDSGLEDENLVTNSLDATMDEQNQVLLHLVQWGFANAAANVILESSEGFSPETLRVVARALAPEAPRRSIHVAGRLYRLPGYEPTREDVLLRLPRPFGDAVNEAAEKRGAPEWILHGLIRTESAWDAVAVSRSGAQGLGQFMPPTWEEWLRRLRYPADSNPEDWKLNLDLSAAYLNWLSERDWNWGWADSLVSYNAGGGRLRGWRRERPGYGSDLFALSVPVEEPRLYVGKVLSAATLYGYLYASLSPQNLHRSWGLEELP